ncbi:hypothetical protein ABVK25_010410 [Lepraria finkii]|uniref:Uncharacterized protein n=1 Tax=Lepraria finkii TaxID=1340010 RepID=A0ABR4B0P2_9LECA
MKSPVDISLSELDIQQVSYFSHTQTPQRGGDPQVSNIKEPGSEIVDDPATGEGSDDPQPASPNTAVAALAISYSGTKLPLDSSSQYNLPRIGKISPGGPPMTTNKVVHSTAPSAAAHISSRVNILTAPAADPPPDPPQASVLTVGNSAYTADSSSNFMIGGQALAPGGSAITTSNTPISLIAGAADAVFGSSTITIIRPASPATASPAKATVLAIGILCTQQMRRRIL